MDKEKFKFVRLKAYQKLVELRLTDLRNYVLEIESKFHKDKILLESQYDEYLKNQSEDDIYDIIESYAEDFATIDDTYISLYRRSILVYLHSFVEVMLINLCNDLHKMNKYPIKLDELRGEGVVRAKDYLVKMAKVRVSTMNKEWSHLRNMNIIRNLIVHCEGDLKAINGSSTRIKNVISHDQYLSLENDRYLSIADKYIYNSIDTTEKFFQSLYEQVL